MVAVLHDLNQAARYATRLVAMRDGAVVAQGTPAEVVTARIVEEVFGVAVLVVDDPVTGTPMIVPRGRSRADGPRSEGRRVPGDRMPDDSPEARPGRGPTVRM